MLRPRQLFGSACAAIAALQLAQCTKPTHWGICGTEAENGVSAEVRIAACTIVIDSAHKANLPNSDLVIALNNRGLGYRQNGALDSALEDLDRAHAGSRCCDGGSPRGVREPLAIRTGVLATVRRTAGAGSAQIARSAGDPRLTHHGYPVIIRPRPTFFQLFFILRGSTTIAFIAPSSRQNRISIDVDPVCLSRGHVTRLAVCLVVGGCGLPRVFLVEPGPAPAVPHSLLP